MRISPADQDQCRRRGRRCSRSRAEIFLQLVMKTMVRQIVSIEVHGGAEIHLQPMEDPMLEQVDAQRRLCPCGKPALK